VYKKVSHTDLFFGTLAGDQGKLVEWNNRQGFYSRAPKYNNYAYDIYCLTVFNDELYAGSMYGILLKWDHSLDVWTLAAPSPTSYVYNIPVHLFVYNGDLYGVTVSSYSTQGLFKWNGSNAWVNVANTPGPNSTLTDLIELNGNLYISDAAGKLFLYNGTSTFVQVLNTPTNPSGQKMIDKLIVFNGKLYAGTSIGPAGISSVLYEWNGSSSTWNIGATAADWHIYSLAEFNGKLYGGSYYSAGHLYEWNGTDAWIQKAELTGYEGLENLVVFNGSLYGGTNNGNLYRWDGVDSLIFVAHFSAQLFCVSQFTY
jgi:hypothetical protein